MATEERERFYKEAKELDIEELRKKVILEEYRSSLQGEIYKLVLNEKEIEENKKSAKEGLKISRSNAASTKRLVWATWCLVIVTFLLVIISFLKK